MVEVAIYASLPLHEISDIIERKNSDIERFGQPDTISRFNLCKKFVLNLAGESRDPLLITRLAMDEVEFLIGPAGPPLEQFYLFKLMLAVYFHDEANMESSSNALLKDGFDVK